MGGGRETGNQFGVALQITKDYAGITSQAYEITATLRIPQGFYIWEGIKNFGVDDWW